jgi:hypothetical protein
MYRNSLVVIMGFLMEETRSAASYDFSFWLFSFLFGFISSACLVLKNVFSRRTRPHRLNRVTDTASRCGFPSRREARAG